MTHKGILIAFEGIDGSGKSSQIKALEATLVQQGYKVYTTFEPTDNTIGTMIRQILKGEIKAAQLTIAALFAADRLHHILNEKEGLLQKIKEGYIVLCDRYYFSSYAYHSVYVDMEWVMDINKQSQALLSPACTLFIDVTPEIAMSRIEKNRTEIDMYETTEMLQKVYQNYMKAFDLLKEKEKICIIKGHEQFDDTAKEIWNVVMELLEK